MVYDFDDQAFIDDSDLFEGLEFDPNPEPTDEALALIEAELVG